MVSLITLEDFVDDEINITILHRKKCLEDNENWCQRLLPKIKDFLENKKFIGQKTCYPLCEVCIDVSKDDNILKIYEKILTLVPKILETLNEIECLQNCLTRNDTIYMKRLSKFLFNIQFDIKMEIFKESILFSNELCTCEND